MPAAYTFSGPLFRLDCEGESSPEEVMQTLEMALQDPAFPDGARLLVDVSRSTSIVHRSDLELLWTAGILGARSRRFGRRMAVVAPSAMVAAIQEAGDMFADHFDAEGRVFADEGPALEWLEVTG